MFRICDRLKELRGKTTQENFAKLIDIHRNTFARWESGQGEPSATQLALIAQKMRINLDWLILGVGPKNIDDSKIKLNEKTADMSPVLNSENENVRPVRHFQNDQLFGNIENIQNKPHGAVQKTADMSDIFKLQQEIIKLLKEKNALTERNATLAIELEKSRQRIAELEREIERLRGELSLLRSRASGAATG